MNFIDDYQNYLRNFNSLKFYKLDFYALINCVRVYHTTDTFSSLR